MDNNLYDVLGVTETASDKDIKVAYKKLARKFHPDVSTEDNAEERFKEVGEAYDILKDSDKRAEYDQLLRYQRDPGSQQGNPFGEQSYSRQGFEGGADMDDLFRSFFDMNRESSRGHYHQQNNFDGMDIESEVSISLEDIVSNTPHTIQLNIEGRQKTLKINLPKGVYDGRRIRLREQGLPGRNGGKNGDLYLIVRFAEHPLYSVEGTDLLVTVPVTPWEAVLGAKITVPTLSSDIRLTIPKNSQSGKKLKIPGKGLPGENGDGNMIVKLNIMVPEAVDEKDTSLWESIEKSSSYDPRVAWRRQSHEH